MKRLGALRVSTLYAPVLWGERLLRALPKWLSHPAFTGAIGLASAYFAWQAVVAARDAVRLQKQMAEEERRDAAEAADAQRRATRPYLRFVRASLTDDSSGWVFQSTVSGIDAPKPPPGQSKGLEIEFMNIGQRAAWGVMGTINVFSRAHVAKDQEAMKTSMHSVVCPMESVRTDLAPGDNFVLKCSAYIPSHEFVKVRVLYSDTEQREADSEDELCQFVALRIDRAGVVHRTGELSALMLSPEDEKCGLRKPGWLKRAELPQ